MHYFFTGMLCMSVIALLIARRVIPFFCQPRTPPAKLNRHTRSGQWQAALAALGILMWSFGFNQWATLFLATAGLITLWHVIAWKPWSVMGTPLLWILYLGYLGLGLGLWVAAAYAMGWTSRLSWPIHMLGMAGFGALIIGMITRTALGHTGRALVADSSMVCSYGLVAVADCFAPHSTERQHLSATVAACQCPMLGFSVGLYLWRFVPWLVRPRADQRSGKPIPIQRPSH
jgi:Uncharacterized protein involved in response to NO